MIEFDATKTYFGEVIMSFLLRRGHRWTRAGWKNVSYIAAQYPDEHSANTRPYIFAVDQEGQRVPWLASPVDLFADDWKLVQDERSNDGAHRE